MFKVHPEPVSLLLNCNEVCSITLGIVSNYTHERDILEKSKYLAGEKYSIADIATWPWIARHEWHDIGLKKFKNLSKWYLDIASRDAVIKGYDFYNNGTEIPKP